ncbi:hypothetical protein GIB67_029308 [Kingdonia uniflora]|uniref:Peptidase S54 rhomboid domain-containing protein n=1 Tax=Kingdonia uniflora TaxID=39325 RepID=A0A7J7N898_9MAGN|nr:hypothetical protein GIB67_029308 [Kingdonia uniflora]
MERDDFPLQVLQALNKYCRLKRKPPVTSALIVANTIIYFRSDLLDKVLPMIEEVGFNPHLILKDRDLKRFLVSAFFHLDELHLGGNNMTSLLWKGFQLENSMGSAKFASMVATLLGMSHVTTLLLTKSLTFFNIREPYYLNTSVGFSGVLFAMEVVLNDPKNHNTSVEGLVVPARHAAWAKLIILHILGPKAAFLGHLAGILAGILYLRLKRLSPGQDPLATMVKGVTGVLSCPFKFTQSLFQLWWRRISGRRTVAGKMTGWSLSGVWRCPVCIFYKSRKFKVCKTCGIQRDC